MGAKSEIEWTEATWNPIRGCSRVSQGCFNCYAEREAMRHAGPGDSYEGLVQITNGHPQWTGLVRLIEGHLADPLRWRKPRRIFVNSMSDLFHESLPMRTITAIFGVMALCQRHTFQILTKRPERFAGFLDNLSAERCVAEAFKMLGAWPTCDMSHDWPLPNVWLGVSCEDQAAADKRIPLVLRAPAAVRWVSAEPLLGPIDFERIVLKPATNPEGGEPPVSMKSLSGWHGGFDRPQRTKIDWVVAGGESGPGARPMHPDWARSLRDQCQAAGVSFFFKQWGRWAPFTDAVERYGHIGDNRSYVRALQKMKRAHGGLRLLTDRPEGWRPYMIEQGEAGELKESMFLLDVGKKAAGRLLDGREWSQYPQTKELSA